MFEQEEQQESYSEEEQKLAYEKLFGVRVGECPPQPKVMEGNGRKFTRIRSRSRRPRRHPQRGGALGANAPGWAKTAQDIMSQTCPADTSKTLQFYRLIIFIDLINLLELDSQQPDRDKCNDLVTAICTHLNDENILTAYFRCTFGSLTDVVGGVAGTAYAASSIFPYFTQVLTYIVSNPATTMVVNLALTFVSNVLPYTGLDPRTPTGIINWGIVIYGLFNPGPPSPAQVATVEQSFLRRQGSNIQQIVITRVKTTVRAFSDAPGGLMRIIKAAKYYAEHGARQAVTDACSGAVRMVLGTLVSSGEVRQDMLIQLGGAFERIVQQVSPEKAAEMKCKFIKQFTDQAGAELLQELQTAAIIDPAKMQAAVATVCVSTAVPPTVSLPPALSVPPPVYPVGPHSLSIHPPPQPHWGNMNHERFNRLTSRGGITGTNFKPKITQVIPGGIIDPANLDSSLRVQQQPKANSRWDKKSGGSSKHKKNHPRPTNKRKLLVKRVRRRSMKHKKKCN